MGNINASSLNNYYILHVVLAYDSLLVLRILDLGMLCYVTFVSLYFSTIHFFHLKSGELCSSVT